MAPHYGILESNWKGSKSSKALGLETHTCDINVGFEIMWYSFSTESYSFCCFIVLGHGCWEDGLPHEPRSLLFKALHNLLER